MQLFSWDTTVFSKKFKKKFWTRGSEKTGLKSCSESAHTIVKWQPVSSYAILRRLRTDLHRFAARQLFGAHRVALQVYHLFESILVVDLLWPTPFYSTVYSSPDHSPQPRIDFPYYEISEPDICSLICEHNHTSSTFHLNASEQWKTSTRTPVGPH